MDVRAFIATALHELEAVLRDDRSARIAAISGLAAMLVVSTLTVLVSRLRVRRHGRPNHSAAPAINPGGWDLGDWGVTPSPPRAGRAPSPEMRWPVDRLLPRRIPVAIAVAAAIALAVWLVGLSLAPNLQAFLASPEWRYQPLYIATHIIAVRLFVRVYTRGFERGVLHLDMPPDKVRTLVQRVLGFPGAAAAIAIALPFVSLDFLYLFSDRYTRMGGPDAVLPIDYLMWGIWTIEWFLNAFIWVVLVGFLIKTAWVVRTYPFKAPIEIVLHDKHYKPFLQMSAQGASIVLLFTLVTVGYIRYTGGELTDYVGLSITALLLVVGFVASWLMLRNKVSAAVEHETSAMRGRLLRNLELAQTEASEAIAHGRDRPGDILVLERQLDAAVAMLRISHLEGRHQNLGASEARAVLVRMLAPAASVGWQVAKTQGATLSDLQGFLARFF